MGVFLIGSQVIDLIGDLAVDDLAVRGLDETERIDARVGGERADQADVRAFRGLDRAHAAVVRGVNVTDLEACTLTRQTAGAKCRQTTLVGQARERVGLIHELRQLRRAEELLDGGHDRADVDQGLRRNCLDVLRGHALANDALHAGKTGADLILNQLADGTQATIAEVVDVIGLDANLAALRLHADDAGMQADDVLDRSSDVVDGEHALSERRVDAQLLVDLVATDLREVITLGIEVEVVEQVARVLDRGRFSRTQLAVDIEQCVFLGGDVILLEGRHEGLVLAEALDDLLVAPAKGLEENGDGLLALAVNTNCDEILLVNLELEPCATARDDLGDEDVLVTGLVDRALEVGAR